MTIGCVIAWTVDCVLDVAAPSGPKIGQAVASPKHSNKAKPSKT